MITFMLTGVDDLDLEELFYIIDKHNKNQPSLAFLGSFSDYAEITCYDSELGKQYEGAQALSMLIEYRKKGLC